MFLFTKAWAANAALVEVKLFYQAKTLAVLRHCGLRQNLTLTTSALTSFAHAQMHVVGAPAFIRVI